MLFRSCRAHIHDCSAAYKYKLLIEQLSLGFALFLVGFILPPWSCNDTSLTHRTELLGLQQ